eukprot:5929829-Amphidinium_carterae.1
MAMQSIPLRASRLCLFPTNFTPKSLRQCPLRTGQLICGSALRHKDIVTLPNLEQHPRILVKYLAKPIPKDVEKGKQTACRYN